MKRRKRHTQVRQLSRAEVWILAEADYIVARAAAGEGRVVSLEPLVFFSTTTGDAWLLDAQDSLALCLAREAAQLPVTITGETPERFAIEWGGTFQIKGDVMTFADNEGGVPTISRYPIREITEALRRARM